MQAYNKFWIALLMAVLYFVNQVWGIPGLANVVDPKTVSDVIVAAIPPLVFWIENRFGFAKN